MGTCSSSTPSGGKGGNQQLQSLNLRPLIKRLQQKYERYRKLHLQQSQSSDILTLQQQIRNIYTGLIKENIMLANENKITMKECKIEISQEMLQLQIMVLKYVQQQIGGDEDKVQLIKKFYTEMGSFLVTLARFLKTIYPRGQSVQAGQLSKRFKEFDNTEDYEYDILKNAGFVFSSADQFDITNTIKLFLNKIMKELDENFSYFYQLVEGIDPAFKIGRKVSQNTSRYLKLDTGTVEIKSTEVARVLIKWMQDLSQTLNFASQKISSKNEYKFYKQITQENKIQFSKCQQNSLTKFLNGGLIYMLEQQKTQSQKKAEQRRAKFRKFNLHLVQVFNQVEHKQSQVSRQEMQVIKYSAFNNSFITWMVEQQLIQTIKHLIEAASQYNQFRGTLDLIKFKINDLMRCQIFGDRKKIIKVFEKFKQLQEKDIIHLVKIKNRFSTPMSDAMIFFKLPQSFVICECQLILSQQGKGEDAKKAKNIQTLNHFLYQLERSPFGVLGEISVFLTAKSQTVSSYCDKIKLFKNDTKRIDQCLKEHGSKSSSVSKKKFKQQKSPFVCSKCLNFYKKFENKLKTHYCQKCIVFLCNACMDQSFDISEEMIIETIGKKLTSSFEQIKKTKIYRQKTKQMESSFNALTASQLLKNCFYFKKLTETPIIKENVKSGKLKISAIIDYIHSKQDYVKIYMQKGVKVNFVLITWRGQETRLKCYRYDNDQGTIGNVFQSIQKYEAHESMQVNQFDLLGEFVAGGFCGVNEKNKTEQINDGFQLKARSILQRGLYIFQGQTKNSTIQHLQGIPQKQRHKYLLKTFEINQNLSLIIDIDHSLKRSDEMDKLKQYLNQVAKNQQKKMLKMTDMKINNETIRHFIDHRQWMNKVKILNLSDNNISSISVVTQYCANLQKLNISRNRLIILRFHKQLKSLQQLDSSQNSIQKIVNLHNVRKIQILKLQSNKLAALTKWVDGQKKAGGIKGWFGKKQQIQQNRKVMSQQVVSLRQRDMDKAQFSQQRQRQLQNTSKGGFLSFFNICQFPNRVQQPNMPYSMNKIQLNLQNEGGFEQVEYQIVEFNSKKFKNKQSDITIYPNLRQILLANNQFISLEQFTKKHFPNLTFLDMNDNLIQELPSLTSDKLEQLHIANNRISNITNFAQIENSTLTVLDLRNNQIKQIPKLNQHSLQKVNFAFNNLQKIDQFMKGDYFDQLTELHLSHVDIKLLSHHLPKTLKVLSLQRCQLVNQSVQTFFNQTQFPKLRELYLTRNKLTKLPKIDKLQKITAIFLQQNPIEDISVLDHQIQQNRLQMVQNSEIKEKQKQKKKVNKNVEENGESKLKKQQKKKGQYLYLSRLWISLNAKSQTYKTQKQKLQQYLLNTKMVCWRYDGVFGAYSQRPKRKFQLFQSTEAIYKQLIIKRIYLLNVFQHEVEVNNRYQLQEETGFYYLEHQWDNIDMDEFVKYDWNQIDFLDLRGTGMDDKKWKVMVQNAYLLPNLKEIEIWEHKITSVLSGDLQKFTKLEKISFFQSNAWANPLNEQSKEILKKFKLSHPNIIVKFQEQAHSKAFKQSDSKTQMSSK